MTHCSGDSWRDRARGEGRRGNSEDKIQRAGALGPGRDDAADGEVLEVGTVRQNRKSFLFPVLLSPGPQSNRMGPPAPLMETHDFLWLLP